MDKAGSLKNTQVKTTQKSVDPSRVRRFGGELSAREAFLGSQTRLNSDIHSYSTKFSFYHVDWTPEPQGRHARKCDTTTIWRSRRYNPPSSPLGGSRREVTRFDSWRGRGIVASWHLDRSIEGRRLSHYQDTKEAKVPQPIHHNPQ